VVDDCVNEPVATAFAQNSSVSSALPMTSISAMSENVILESHCDIIVNPARIIALLSLWTSGVSPSLTNYWLYATCWNDLTSPWRMDPASDW
jgi:hypothetical protein